MNRKEKYKLHEEYIKSEGLDKLINFSENIDFQKSVFDSVSGKMQIPIPPDAADLTRIYELIKERKPFTVMEFGSGYSTIIIADALYKNEKKWNNLASKPQIRNRYMFQLFSVETSAEWIEKTKKRLPDYLMDRVHFQLSDVEIGTYNGQICHYYKNLPDIVPDFIYLDGPSARDVKGNINGLSFNCLERTVMSADILLMEPILLPGLFILVDGRVNNARFLERNLKRKYNVISDKVNDITTFELIEERLGKYNLVCSDFI